jgi:hypothetical protein
VKERSVRRLCVTYIVAQSLERSPREGSSTSTQFLMAFLVAALAAAIVTLGAMFGWRIDA